MMMHLTNSMGKGEAMGKRGRQRGSGLVYQIGDVRGRRMCVHHRSGQRGGIGMSGTWTERGAVTDREGKRS
jgi:hypothetical protein